MPLPCISVDAVEERAVCPIIPEVTTAPDILARFLERLKAGIVVMKHGRGGKPHKRTFAFNSESNSLSYSPTKKRVAAASIFLREVLEIRQGHQTKVFKRSGHPNRSQFAFSLVRRNGHTLDIEVQSESELQLWIQGIAYLVRQAKELYDEDPTRIRLLELWLTADHDNNMRLNFKETMQMLRELNIVIDRSIVKMKFNQFDRDKSGELVFSEFTHFYKYLVERPEIKVLFERYALQNSDFLGMRELTKFMHEEQGENGWTDADSQRAILRLNGNNTIRPALTVAQFTDFLAEPTTNSWWNPIHLTVYQNMDLPIHNYFWASSHNTYLAGDQLVSESTVDMYKKILLKGCRCIELDCWDGQDGEPIIYHGHTRTTRIYFKDVIFAIRDTAFVASPYPVSLSLEVHTNLDQQRKMAEYMCTIFGDLLAESIAFSNPPPNPLDHTPNKLKNKILVKAKMCVPKEPDTDSLDEINNPEHASSLTTMPSPPPQEEEEDDDFSDRGNDNVEIEFQKPKKLRTNKKGVAPALSAIVYLRSLHMENPTKSKEKGNFWEISSFAENKLFAMIRQGSLEFAEANKRMNTRVYPKGTRINSDNYDPQPAWNVGSQAVALNYQTNDFPMRLNDAKFTQNGGCGYLLKPTYLRVPDHPYNQYGPKRLLIVDLFTGSNLPKASRSKKGRIINAYVKLFITGCEQDTTDVPFRTNVVEENGFNPIWNKEFQFPIHAFELAILTLRVVDKDPAMDEEIAEASIPIESLRTGYHCVPLNDIVTSEIFENSSLFCRFRLQEFPT
eukprot:NODE_270_length_2529_cov_78.808493_g251_i0.p1 GENE.NODE_270_length_2529_cov_78.808493_g251_i0~~NODE_270_length_2529_cov_78.808493_g251_i0.p1  ORF type:complete len:787 (-),score=210.45 NODE_270_length_2529_cov_78.808493_g251_i0:102-2462(-)